MYGYRPPSQEPEGSWREALLMIRVVFEMLAPILGVIVGVLLLVVLTFVLLFQFAPLALIPIAILAVGVAWLVRRDRRLQADEERRILGR
jgi:hypothetical protein